MTKRKHMHILKAKAKVGLLIYLVRGKFWKENSIGEPLPYIFRTGLFEREQVWGGVVSTTPRKI